MRVPLHLALLRRLVCLPLVLSAALACAVRGPQPDLRIPLDPLGFQPLTQDFLLHGSSMLTLDFVDNQHLLLTFEAHTLLKRIPNDPPTDQDRVIRAVLVELPSGRALAHTDWRVHDRGQYLWNLAGGHFLLRIRDTLTTFAPLINLAAGDAFRQQPFINVLNRHIGALQITPEADILTIETKAIEPTEKPVSETSSAEPANPAASAEPVQINFYRIDNSGDRTHAIYAGAGRSRIFGTFALTTAGYLEVLDQGRHHWAFNFDTFGGKVWELAPFDSTCRPSPIFVSHTEFIAFGCRGPGSPPIFGGFNMRGEQTWQQGLYGDSIATHLAFAPASGRFAFSRILTTTPLADTEDLIPETLSSQTVVVYQSGSGRQVLKVECSPIEPAGQNFALSPDGLTLGAIHDGAIEIYKLPTLTSKEQADLKRSQDSGPKPADLPVRMAAGATAPSSTDEAVPSATTPTAQPAAPAAAATPATKTAVATPANPAPAPQTPVAQPTTTTESASEDQQPAQHRKPPTLYTLPTDPPHNQSPAK